ncbi:ATP-dependent acyl-CoA ligase [Paractinoplanes deccanensis]|uniref:ATP-dependent acyl-CoA ligase n=1 Tax=Paractinoplanes deccanensis TaxID=113561 RepID=A0ABQ3YM26_9ACTN|nr:AMP-binding protein [Actinoplanes deccanensis]GID80850.1 ATP-dependent acyl-CoA ligase [Actinoplanes deccanensis]
MIEVVDRPETVIDVLARRAAADPRAIVATFAGDPRRNLTVGELLRSAERIARLLASPSLGLLPGESVLTCLRPGPALVAVLAGVARAGLVEVPVTADGGTPSAGRVALLGTGALAGNPRLATIAPIVRTVDDGGGPGDLDDLRPGPLGPRPGPGDPALVLSTSGTTGRPKGVLLPHFAGVRHARRVTASMRYGPDDVLYNAFPWNHVNIRHAGLLAALVSGARLVAVPRFSASAFWELCRAEGVTAFNFMGAVAAILLRGPADRAHRVTRAYGGPAPAWLAARFRERFGVQLVEAYACTELGDVTSNTLGEVAEGTAGRPVPEYDVRLDDGRIAVRPRAKHISALGYVGSSEPPPEWVLTGDLGDFDGDGRLVFRGRHADVIRRRGENISAWQVESVVAAMPGVREAAAVGVPSELTEEDLLVAAVGAVTEEDVHAWCRDRLPRYAWPRYVVLLDALPRNAAAKVSKSRLRDVAGKDLEHLRRKDHACESWT